MTACEVGLAAPSPRAAVSACCSALLEPRDRFRNDTVDVSGEARDQGNWQLMDMAQPFGLDSLELS